MSRLFLFLSIVLVLGISNTRLIAQRADTTRLENHSSNKAALFSAIIPGLGQAYNKKYWKMPIVYAGFAGLGYAIYFNNKNYQRYLSSYKAETDNNPFTVNKDSIYNASNLIIIKDFYRRNRDLAGIGLVVFYAMNIIDAYVDAELYYFDVSDKLSMQVRPALIPTGYPGNSPLLSNNITGLKLTLRL